MAAKGEFTEEELTVDEGLGYPKAYAHLCRSPNVFNPYAHGPPFAYVPYALQPQEALRAKDFNQMFPIIDPDANPSENPRGYVNLLWNQLDHLGNAGFDPALFRVDSYGNVLYLHADSASPLAWETDHWFPCSRGGKTILSNLRILQSQVCKRKHNKLEFLIPWWDLQLGISVNQFLGIFASRNSDFRNRGFSFLFSNGRSEELNALKVVDSHSFPQRFIDMKRRVGLAPAAIVSAQTSSDALVLKALDLNRSLRHNSLFNAARKFPAEDADDLGTAIQRFRPTIDKENGKPDMDVFSCNPHLSITMARDSLRQREETKKKQAEISRLDGELNGLKQKNDSERAALQDLEEVLIKRRRRVEKCRRLSEAQCSYRALLEKMIRDAMHQSVVYKEQLRLNQSATSALMARLEAQRAICDSSENELRRRFKQRDEIEKQIRPCWAHARKRSRMDDTSFEERHDKSIQLLRTRKPLKKELREFLEEAKKASEAEVSLGAKEELEIEEEETTESIADERYEKSRTVIVPMFAKIDSPEIREENCSKTPAPNENSFPPSRLEDEEEYRTMLVAKDEISKLTELEVREGCRDDINQPKMQSSISQSRHEEDEEEHRRLVGSKDDISITDKLKELAIREGPSSKTDEPRKSWFPQSPGDEDEEEYRDRVGKGTVEKWLQILLENAEGSSVEPSPRKAGRQENNSEEIVRKLNLVNPQKEIKYLRLKPLQEKACLGAGPDKQQINEKSEAADSRSITLSEKSNNIIGLGSGSACKGFGSRKSFEAKGRVERKEVGLAGCESARGFRSLPSSPSVLFGMRKGVDCMGTKPKVIGDEDDVDENLAPTNKFIKTCTKAIKKAMNK